MVHVMEECYEYIRIYGSIMDIWNALSLFGGCVIIILVVQFLRVLFSDCDLDLWWAENFGKKPEDLAGKVVWITGASSGIGEQLAYRLAKARCKLVLSARREEELQRVKKQCILHGQIKSEDVMVLPMDMKAIRDHQTTVNQVLQHFSQIDILVNNAGRSQRAEALKTSLEVYRELLELNTISVLSLTKAVLPHMVSRKSGHLVVTSSVAGKMGVPNSAGYSLSKFALHGWFESLSIDLAAYNIKVTMACPGPVFSDVLKNSLTEDVNKVFGEEMKPDDNRMTSERCAELIAIGMANQLYEVWISRNPVLLVTYAVTYMPAISRKVAMFLGPKVAKRIRDGR